MSTGLKAVIFDWAGTMIDHGSLAPMGVFVQAFRRFRIEITIDEARGPMGMAKRDHVQAILSLARVREAWRAAHGREPTDADVDAVYDVFLPMNLEVSVHYAELIPGAAGMVEELLARGLKVGSTTGYTHAIMDRILPIAERQGYRPDCLVCTGDTAQGRPSPLMMYSCFLQLGVWPASACVKVDDTEVGIAEGRNAGCWTMGVSLSGNLCGLTHAELQALAPAQREAMRETATGKLQAAGADYVVDSVADLMPVLEEIAIRIDRGDRP